MSSSVGSTPSVYEIRTPKGDENNEIVCNVVSSIVYEIRTPKGDENSSQNFLKKVCITFMK